MVTNEKTQSVEGTNPLWTDGHMDGRTDYHVKIKPKEVSKVERKKQIQLNPAIAHFKGLIKIKFYIEVFIITKIQKIVKMLLGFKICMLY